MDRVTTSDGVAVAVHDLGGDGPPLVLAHATGFNGRVWAPMVDRLKARFRCLAVDHRGHGDSGAPPGTDFGWRGLGQDVLAVVDGLGIEAPFGIGHSAGGTALLLAEEARPGTFRAIYCFEPVMVPVDPPLGPDPDSWLAAAARKRRDVFASRVEAHEHYASKPPLDTLDGACLRAYVDHGFEDLPDGTVRLKCRPEHEALMAEMATEHDCFTRLDRIACPVMLAGGEATEGYARSTEPLLSRLRPMAQVQVLAGLGHLGPMQAPDEVGHSASEFLTGISSVGKARSRELLRDQHNGLALGDDAVGSGDKGFAIVDPEM